ncbi:MAG: hypothetical protein IT362_11290 [Deltaproteobacteria bacterium]|nr:hypothetical protein [Deltaproteobacteria bacterium]
MAKHIMALKGILKFEERLLGKLLKTLPLVSEEDTRVLLAEMARSKRGHIRAYKKAISKGEKGRKKSGKNSKAIP